MESEIEELVLVETDALDAEGSALVRVDALGLTRSGARVYGMGALYPFVIVLEETCSGTWSAEC